MKIPADGVGPHIPVLVLFPKNEFWEQINYFLRKFFYKFVMML